MTTINWNITTIDGQEYVVFDVTKFRVPLNWDPSGNFFFAVAVPDGGVGSIPALAQGDDGETPEIDNVINFTALAWDDPTAAFASWTETSPNVYKLNLGLHEGEPGEDGDTVLDPTDFGTPTAGQILVVDPAETGFDYQTQKVGDRYIPASLNSTPSGNSAYTLGVVSVPAQDWDWRPEVSGWCVFTGTGADVQVDLIARLDGESAGNEVGRGKGVVGVNSTGIPTVLVDGIPAGSADAYDKVLAGASATIHLRAERQSGAETFTTSNTTTRFKVRVCPVP